MLKISLDNIELSKVSSIYLWVTDRTHGALSTHLDKTTTKAFFDEGLMTLRTDIGQDYVKKIV